MWRILSSGTSDPGQLQGVTSSLMQEKLAHDNWPHVPWPSVLPLITATIITCRVHLSHGCPLLQVLNCIKVLQKNRTNRIHREIFKRRLVMTVGSCDYGSWEVPWYAVCKLENQGSQGCNSVWVRMPKNSESRWRKFRGLKAWEPGAQVSEGRRKWMSQLKKRENWPFFHPF